MKTLFPLLALITLHSSLSTVYSQWPTTPDSGLVVGYGDFPSIVSDDDGGAILAFRANNPSQIKVKRVDKYGDLQWNGFSGVIAGGTADWQDYSEIAEDGRGGVLVSFQDIDCYTDCYLPWMTYSSYVTVNRIDHLGNKLWGEGIRVTVHDTIIQSNAQVRSDAHAGAVVSWLQNGYIYVQRIDSIGSRMWGDTGMVIGKCFEGLLTVVNNNGDVFIKWTEQFQPVWIDRIQKLNMDGQKLWSDSGQVIYQVGYDLGLPTSDGGVVIAGFYLGPWLHRLTCQKLDSNGIKQWGGAGVTLVDSISASYSTISSLFLSEDTLFVSYWHSKFGFTDFFVQKVDPFGNKLFGDIGRAVSPFPSSKGGNMVRSDDSLLFVWNDGRGGGYCQKLDWLGNRLWTEDRYFYSEEYGYSTDDRKGGAVVLSQELDFSISLSKVSKNGNVGEVVTSLPFNERPSNTNRFELLNIFPNPFNPSTVIQFVLKTSCRAELNIYNILGEEVVNLIDGFQSQGVHSVPWDGKNQAGKEVASGTYICALKVNGLVHSRKMILLR